MTKQDLKDRIETLQEVQDELLEAVRKARTSLISTGRIGKRAEAYWLGHLEGFVEEEGRSSTTLQDTINELQQTLEGDPEHVTELMYGMIDRQMYGMTDRQAKEMLAALDAAEDDD
jgi:hypothetical protein